MSPALAFHAMVRGITLHLTVGRKQEPPSPSMVSRLASMRWWRRHSEAQWSSPPSMDHSARMAPSKVLAR